MRRQDAPVHGLLQPQGAIPRIVLDLSGHGLFNPDPVTGTIKHFSVSPRIFPCLIYRIRKGESNGYGTYNFVGHRIVREDFFHHPR